MSMEDQLRVHHLNDHKRSLVFRQSRSGQPKDEFGQKIVRFFGSPRELLKGWKQRLTEESASSNFVTKAALVIAHFSALLKVEDDVACEVGKTFPPVITPSFCFFFKVIELTLNLLLKFLAFSAAHHPGICHNVSFRFCCNCTS